MKPLAALLRGLGAQPPMPDVTVAGLTLDSRRVLPGDAFLALAGSRGHGLDHAGAALRAGAAVVIHDSGRALPADLDGRHVRVPGLDDQVALLARRMWDDPAAGLDLIAITGTNGKTSLAWLLAQALDGAMIGTLGIGRPGALDPATHTTPDLPGLYRALARLRDRGESVVTLEASSHALDQRRLEGLSFTTTVFTNLGRDHLDYHGSMDAYGRAKSRLFLDYESRRQMIDIDDPFGRALSDKLAARPGRMRYGLEPRNTPDLLGTLRRADLDGLTLEIDTRSGPLVLESRLIARVNARNLLVVAGELLARSVSADEIVRRIAALESVPGRMNRIDDPSGRRVVIDYAHSPDALGGALDTLRELTPGQLLCVFGCGGDRDRGKRPQMGRVAETGADRVVLTNDNPRGEEPLAILREIQAGMTRPERARVIADRAEAIAWAIAEATPGDCVLVAGKGHEQTQEFADRTVAFSDFDAVRDAFTEAA